MSRVVVIGATGHIGTYLVPRLVRAGHEVTAISRGTREPYHLSPQWRAVRRVTADRDAEDAAGTHVEPGGRFRLDVTTLKKRGDWSWQQNPFVGTNPYQGLLVILAMFDSSDLKNVNNTLYEATTSGDKELWYVVRDLGTALGETGRLAPKRSDPGIFERYGFTFLVKPTS